MADYLGPHDSHAESDETIRKTSEPSADNTLWWAWSIHASSDQGRTAGETAMLDADFLKPLDAAFYRGE
jgi:hypothetical protein